MNELSLLTKKQRSSMRWAAERRVLKASRIGQRDVGAILVLTALDTIDTLIHDLRSTEFVSDVGFQEAVCPKCKHSQGEGHAKLCVRRDLLQVVDHPFTTDP